MLKDRIQCLLDEGRMLLLGAQVLLGFASQAVLEPGFADLSSPARTVCAAGALAMAAAVGLLMWPAAYHRIVTGGEDEPGILAFAGAVLNLGMAPFAAGLAAAFYVVAERAAGPATAAPAAIAVIAAAAGAWFAIPWWSRTRPARKDPPRMTRRADTDLPEKIRQVLTEARMVLPGAQALLGFGTIAVLSQKFATLPPLLRTVHVVGLCFIALATILLMTPAAFHRLAEGGAQTRRFHAVAGRLVLGAMAALAPGLAAGIWLVMEVATGSRTAGLVAALAVVGSLYAAWFGWSLAVRAARSRRGAITHVRLVG